tara:strand:- start:386 stop:694 length:309 start_codon:yes stop_codon:yes gene_type:complete
MKKILFSSLTVLALLVFGTACQTTKANSSSEVSCCEKAEELLAQIPDCCKKKSSECCKVDAAGKKQECCEKAEALMAQMAPCCRKAVEDPASARGCCASMNK